MKVTGTFQGLKEFQTARGTMYSIKVDGDLYGVGDKPVEAPEGSTVSFEFTTRGKYKNADPRTFVVTAAAPNRPTTGGGKSGYDTRQDVISRQSAYNSALQFTELLIAIDGLPIPKTAKNKVEALGAFVNEKMIELYEQNTGSMWVDIAPDNGDSGPSGAEEAEADAEGDGNWR